MSKIYFYEINYTDANTLNKYYEKFPEYGHEIIKRWNGVAPNNLNKDLQSLVNEPYQILLLPNRRHEVGWVEKGTYDLGVPPLNRPLTDEHWTKHGIRPIISSNNMRLLRILKTLDSTNEWYHVVGSKLHNVMLFNHGFTDLISAKLMRDLFKFSHDRSPIYEQTVKQNKRIKIIYDEMNKPYGEIPELSEIDKNIESFVTNPCETTVFIMMLDKRFSFMKKLHWFDLNQLKLILDNYPKFIQNAFVKFISHDNLYIDELITRYKDNLSINHKIVKAIINNPDYYASKSMMKFIHDLSIDKITYKAYKLLQDNDLLSVKNYNEYYHHAPTEVIAMTSVMLKNPELRVVYNLNTRLSEIWLAWHEQSDDYQDTIKYLFEDIVSEFKLDDVVDKLIKHKLTHLSKYNIVLNDYLITKGLVSVNCKL